MARARSAGEPPEPAAAPPEPPRRKPPKPPKPPPPPPAAPEAGTRVSVDAGVVKGLARSASRIVSQASTILEEELAAGIGAAKQIEARLVDVAEMRSTNPDEVMARFRRDAHEVVDIVLDLLNVPTRSLGGLVQRISVGDGSPAAVASPSDAPTIKLPGDVPAGGSATVPFSLENDGDTPTAEFTFQATDLVNADGEKIAASHVTFEPASLTIPAHDRESVTISVEVPKGTAPGVYSGLVLASKLERVRAVLVVSVDD